MVKQIVRDVFFLGQPSEPATKADIQVGKDLQDTLQANRERCVGMAANMIGVKKNIIIVNMGFINVVMFNPVIVSKRDMYETEEGCLSLDAVDYKLISICHKGDIVVSQDYGVAAMALGKNAYAIHQSGKWYTNENIDQMLMERHLNKKARRASGKNHLKGPRKRTSEDDEHFRESFEKMIHMAMDKEN